MVNAATTRAKLLLGRSKLCATEWRKAASKDLTCPLCVQEEEDITHFLVHCPMLHDVRNGRVLALQDMYRADDQAPPCSPQEIVSAILNGHRYLPECSLLGGSQPKPINLKKLTTEAHQLCNKLCYKLIQTRDVIINSALMNDI